MKDASNSLKLRPKNWHYHSYICKYMQNKMENDVKFAYEIFNMNKHHFGCRHSPRQLS